MDIDVSVFKGQEDLDCQLFVRTFPPGTEDDHLRAAFSPFGEVTLVWGGPCSEKLRLGVCLGW